MADQVGNSFTSAYIGNNLSSPEAVMLCLSSLAPFLLLQLSLNSNEIKKLSYQLLGTPLIPRKRWMARLLTVSAEQSSRIQ